MFLDYLYFPLTPASGSPPAALRFAGLKKLRGLRKRVEKAYWILAIVPTMR